MFSIGTRLFLELTIGNEKFSITSIGCIETRIRIASDRFKSMDASTVSL